MTDVWAAVWALGFGGALAAFGWLLWWLSGRQPPPTNEPEDRK